MTGLTRRRVLYFRSACGSVAFPITVVRCGGKVTALHTKEDKYRSAEGKKIHHAARPYGDRITPVK